MASRSTDAESADSPPTLASASPYTFVNLNENAKDKRTSGQQRREVKSHVMKYVRAQETAQGVKRPSGREPAKKKSTPRSRSSLRSLYGDGSDLSDNFTSPASAGQSGSDSSASSVVADRALERACDLQEYYAERAVTLWRNQTPGNNSLDPFGTLPGATGPSSFIDSLVHHCFKVFVPTSFPMEHMTIAEIDARCGGVLQHAISRSSTFFGYMATTAAHRAALADPRGDPRQDPDYCVMKEAALAITRADIDDAGSGVKEKMDAFLGLTFASTLAGEFKDAREQIRSMKALSLELPYPDDPYFKAQMSFVDIKASYDTPLQRPEFEIPWEKKVIELRLLARITPPYTDPLSALATAFPRIERLSHSLRASLDELRNICWLCELNMRTSGGLSAAEHEVLRQKGQEVEHTLLSYWYVCEKLDPDPAVSSNGQIHPLEDITRIAGLAMLNQLLVKAIPSTGVGKALTRHQWSAFQKWQTECAGEADQTVLELVIWSLFLCIQGAAGQAEERYFSEALTEMLHRRDLRKGSGWTAWQTDWNTVSMSLCTFLYVPSSQAKPFQECWGRCVGR